MDIVIRKGVKKDVPAILKLIKELAHYENSDNEVTITIEELKRDGFGKQPVFWFLVAEKNG